MTNTGAASGGDRTPTLRWIFARSAERLQCEIALDWHQLVYEFRIRRLDGPASEAVEQFRDVAAAFQRQSQFEAELLGDGWSLAHYAKLEVLPG